MLQCEWVLKKNYAKWKKPDIKDYVMQDFVHIKYPENVNL